MRDFESSHNYEITKHDYKKVDGVMRIIERNLYNGYFADPVEKALFVYLRPQLADDGLLRPELAEVFALHRQMNAFLPVSHALRRLEFNIDKQMRMLFGGQHEYPGHFAYPAWWFHRDVISEFDFFTLHEDMRHPLQSNMHKFYDVFPPFAYAYKDRYGENSTVLDNGASGGTGLVNWMLNDKHVPKLRVVKQPRPGQPIADETLETDQEFQDIVDDLCSKPSALTRAVGYDTIPINTDDENAVRRMRSHTFPMSEAVWRGEEAAEFDRLIEAKRENDEKLRQDFRALGQNQADKRSEILLNQKLIMLPNFVDATDDYMLMQLEQYLPDGKADMGIYSAVFFQHTPETVSDISANTDVYYRDGSPKFIADFAFEDHSAPNGLRMIRGDWWHRPGSFALFVIDPEESSLPVELARFSNRRGEAMWLSDYGRRLLRRAIGNA